MMDVPHLIWLAAFAILWLVNAVYAYALGASAGEMAALIALGGGALLVGGFAAPELWSLPTLVSAAVAVVVFVSLVRAEGLRRRRQQARVLIREIAQMSQATSRDVAAINAALGRLRQLRSTRTAEYIDLFERSIHLILDDSFRHESEIAALDARLRQLEPAFTDSRQPRSVPGI